MGPRNLQSQGMSGCEDISEDHPMSFCARINRIRSECHSQEVFGCLGFLAASCFMLDSFWPANTLSTGSPIDMVVIDLFRQLFPGIF